jgi:hypothetical protein
MYKTVKITKTSKTRNVAVTNSILRAQIEYYNKHRRDAAAASQGLRREVPSPAEAAANNENRTCLTVLTKQEKIIVTS